MWQKKHEKSKIRSFRASQMVDDFFKDTFINKRIVKNCNTNCITANDFLLNLIENSKEYKNYLALKNRRKKSLRKKQEA